MGEQFRVPWSDRAKYMAILRDLKRALDRELDAVQVGAEPTVRFGQSIMETVEARQVYGCQVDQMRKEHPTTE